LGVTPDAIVLSPTARTTETLERIRPGLPADADAWTDRRIYGATASSLLDLIRELPADYGEAMLIGHNPGLGWLAAELAGSAPDAARIRAKYPTGALASFSFGGEWSRLSPGTTTLERFLIPKELG
jgi:phosphohistidine phosphatase